MVFMAWGWLFSLPEWEKRVSPSLGLFEIACRMYSGGTSQGGTRLGVLWRYPGASRMGMEVKMHSVATDRVMHC